MGNYSTSKASLSLAQALQELDQNQLEELQQDVHNLARWLSPWIPQAEALISLTEQGVNSVDNLTTRQIETEQDQLVQKQPPVFNLSTTTRQNSFSAQDELPAESTQLKRFAQGIPGRKWQQMRYFVRHLQPWLAQEQKQSQQVTTSDQSVNNCSDSDCKCEPENTRHILEWCAGKGHLGRLIAYQQQENPEETASQDHYQITSLEWQQKLCQQGEQEAHKWQLQQSFVHGDAFDQQAGELIQPHTHAVALHACGDLHCQLIHHASQRQARSLLIAPCCYHLIRADSYQPLSEQAQQSHIQLSKQDLKIPLQETVTGGQRIGNLRDTELLWRMAFDQLQKQQLNSNDYMPLPTIPKHLLTGEFKDFIDWAISNRKLDQCISVDMDVDVKAGVDKLNLDSHLDSYLEKGQQRVQQIRRMELVQHLFRRPLELWLVLDRMLRLQEAGFHVELTEFCQKNLTPRNLLIKAYRSD